MGKERPMIPILLRRCCVFNVWILHIGDVKGIKKARRNVSSFLKVSQSVNLAAAEVALN